MIAAAAMTADTAKGIARVTKGTSSAVMAARARAVDNHAENTNIAGRSVNPKKFSAFRTGHDWSRCPMWGAIEC